MSGRVLRVVEQATYTFTDLIAYAGSTQSIPLALHVDTSQFREGRVIVKIVSVAWADPTNDDIHLAVYADPWSPDLGTTAFFPVGEGSTLVDETLNPSPGNALPTIPYAMFFDLPSNFGPLVQLALVATRTASSSGNLQITLMVELALKD